MARTSALRERTMIPPEVIRDLSVVAEIANTTGGKAPDLSVSWINDLIDRYGMTYPRAIIERDRDKLQEIAKEFRVIFSMGQDELANFSNGVLEKIRFSPRIMNHGGFGWHIHYYDDDFSFDERIRSNTAMSVMSLIIHGEAMRLKTCKAATCDNVFVDTTRNASKIYCDVKTCGNRSHVANFRAKVQEKATRMGSEP
jgi:hypothetical protein